MPMYGGRRRPTSKRSMTSRELANRLWGTPLDPKDDRPPPKRPNNVMNRLLREYRNANRINTDEDPLQ